MKHLLQIFCALLALSASAQRHTIDLSGEWNLAFDNPFENSVHATSVALPGTTDTNRQGAPLSDRSETMQLSRRYSHVGPAWYTRTIEIPTQWIGYDIVLHLERTKPTKVYVNGQFAGASDNISTSQQFDISPFIEVGKPHQITIMVDNAGGVPPEVMQGSHAYVESTQTNWNGIIGDIFLEAREPVHLADLRIYPDVDRRTVRVNLRVIKGERLRHPKVRISAQSFNSDRSHQVPALDMELLPGEDEYNITYPLGPDAQLWSEFSPALYRIKVVLEELDSLETTFGLRRFEQQGRQFAINGTPTFLRGKHDACVFPITAHVPMELDVWQDYLQTLKTYGINHVRFHSWCPPEAAFAAADIEGVYLQPELPFWGSLDGHNSPLVEFLRKEGENIQLEYGNHPSFVMFALGNELWGDPKTWQYLVDDFRALDSRRLYAYGSNAHLGWWGSLPGEDYLTTCRVGGEPWGDTNTHVRASFSFADAYDGGIINSQYPNTLRNFSAALDTVSVPVISHETGQYQVYPNYNEIKKYTGVLEPCNMQVFRQRLIDAGMGDQADDFFHASGALSALLYKEDIEMCLRTPELAGFQLLDLQDYPGQGSAYVGILDAFMDSKGLVTPEQWRGHCDRIVPLAIMKGYTWTNTEPINIGVKLSNYSGASLKGQKLHWSIATEDGHVVDQGSLPINDAKIGLIDLGSISSDFSSLNRPTRLNLTLSLPSQASHDLIANSYPLWVYPAAKISLDQWGGALVVDSITNDILDMLDNGKTVVYMPRQGSQPGLFQTDYWNYRMFKTICENNDKPLSPGTMGLLIDNSHPLFYDFPTESHSNWQWFPIVKASAPMVLDNFPRNLRPIVQVIDNVERNHRLGLIYELAVGPGRLLVVAADMDQAAAHPEGAQLYASIIRYVNSPFFNPSTRISTSDLSRALSAPISSTSIGTLNNISY